MKPRFRYSSLGRCAVALAWVYATNLIAGPQPAPKSPLQSAAQNGSATPAIQKSAASSATSPAGSKSVAPETWGFATFSAPAGWVRKAQADFVSFETTNAAKGTWSVIGVYKNRPGVGDANTNFRDEWRDAVTVKFQAAIPTEVTSSQNPAGYELRVGTAAVPGAGDGAAATLVVASGYGTVITAMFLTNTMDNVPAFDRFIQGVVLQKPTTSVPTAVVTANGPRSTELVGNWMNGSVSGPALYDRSNGSFQGLATGTGRYLELKANGQANMTAMRQNNYGCANSMLSSLDGTWSAKGGVLSINYTSGSVEFNNCGSKSKSPGKRGVETYPYEIYSFEGKPRMSLSFGTAGKESLERSKN